MMGKLRPYLTIMRPPYKCCLSKVVTHCRQCMLSPSTPDLTHLRVPFVETKANTLKKKVKIMYRALSVIHLPSQFPPPFGGITLAMPVLWIAVLWMSVHPVWIHPVYIQYIHLDCSTPNSSKGEEPAIPCLDTNSLAAQCLSL